jgi:hypothetical protein
LKALEAEDGTRNKIEGLGKRIWQIPNHVGGVWWR